MRLHYRVLGFKIQKKKKKTHTNLNMKSRKNFQSTTYSLLLSKNHSKQGVLTIDKSLIRELEPLLSEGDVTDRRS